MAENEEEVQEEQSGGKPWLLILIAVLLAGGAGAGGAFFLLGNSGEAEVSSEASGNGDAASDEAPFAERVFDLDPFVVNVTGEGYPRYLKLQVAFEMDSLESRGEIEARVAQVRDTTILLLSSKRLADITDFEGKALLKDDLRDRVNNVLEEGQVRSVLFTEFVVQ